MTDNTPKRSATALTHWFYLLSIGLAVSTFLPQFLEGSFVRTNLATARMSWFVGKWEDSGNPSLHQIFDQIPPGNVYLYFDGYTDETDTRAKDWAALFFFQGTFLRIPWKVYVRPTNEPIMDDDVIDSGPLPDESWLLDHVDYILHFETRNGKAQPLKVVKVAK